MDTGLWSRTQTSAKFVISWHLSKKTHILVTRGCLGERSFNITREGDEDIEGGL